MSLYRQPGRLRAPVLAAVAVVALLVGGGIGYAIGHSSAPDPSVADAVAELRSELRPAVSGLQLLPNDEPGFWEQLGYHNRGDPWREQRYQGDP